MSELSRLSQAATASAPAPRRGLLPGVAAGLAWPVQAGLIAGVVAGLIGDGPGGPDPWFAAAGVILAGMAGEMAHALAQRRLQAGAEAEAFELRRALSEHELRRAPGSAREDAAVAASLLAERIDLVSIARQRLPLAVWRARTLPVFVLLLVLSQSWLAALVLLFTAPLIPLFQALVGWAAREASERHLVEAGALNAALIDRLAALDDIRLLGATERAADQLDARSRNLAARAMRVLRIAFLSSTVLELFATLGIALVAVLTGFSLLGVLHAGGWHGGLTPFGGFWVLLLAPDFYQPLRDLAQVWHDRAASEAALAEITARDGGETILGQGGQSAPAAPGTLRWQGLVADRTNARKLPDGACAPGEIIVLSGTSGAGKSTLLAILAGLHRPAAGEIFLGETRLGDESADAIRARLGWVPQLPRFTAPSLDGLFQAARPGLTRSETLAALEALDLTGLIARLPEGLASPIGEIGQGISGGEARRLLLARALVTRPFLLLADEPTADLDEATGARIIAALAELARQGSGILAASHDARLIAAADRVIELVPDTPEGAAR